MKHYASSRYWALYEALPKTVRALADKNFALLKSDPTHPSLHFKRIGRLWSVRVGERYRVLGTDVTALCGFGLERMPNTTRLSANRRVESDALARLTDTLACTGPKVQPIHMKHELVAETTALPVEERVRLAEAIRDRQQHETRAPTRVRD